MAQADAQGNRIVAACAVFVCALGIAGCAKPFIEPLHLPAEHGSAQPHLAVAPHGEVVLSWLTRREQAATLYFSTLEADHWTDPVAVAAGPDWFVNWADFPSVQPITQDLWAAHWLVKSAEPTFAYDVAVSLSHDGGSHWAAALADAAARGVGVEWTALDGAAGDLRRVGVDVVGGPGRVGQQVNLDVTLLGGGQVVSCALIGPEYVALVRFLAHLRRCTERTTAPYAGRVLLCLCGHAAWYAELSPFQLGS